MDEKQVIAAFKQNWQKARKDGWRIDHDYFMPPKEHEAIVNNWAAYFYKTDYGIVVPYISSLTKYKLALKISSIFFKVPHWFLRYYPIK